MVLQFLWCTELSNLLDKTCPHMGSILAPFVLHAGALTAWPSRQLINCAGKASYTITRNYSTCATLTLGVKLQSLLFY